MLRLNEEAGFDEAFKAESIDPVKQLDPNASMGDIYSLYKDYVRIAFDPTEGVVEMEVVAPSAELSFEFSEKLLAYASEQVEQLTEQLRSGQMSEAMEIYEDATEQVIEAQRAVQELQQSLGVFDATAESGAVLARANQLESTKLEKELELAQLQSNARPNQSRVTAVQGEIERLEEMIAEVRDTLTNESENQQSLAAINGELRIAEGDLETRQSLLASAAEQLEAARIEANKQTRYLSMVVTPVATDEPTYPKAFQNTVVAFLAFAGLYLMLSLTVSILREQVSS